MSTGKPIRFVMLGGFLGAGKTTALLRLARTYSERGLRVGIITNDQAEGLVDTLAFRDAGFETEEIPSGCFCCHFEKLLEASGRLADGLEPDIILAEPVGSCTDLVNAVIAPLKNVYSERFSVAPYVVLLDPHRAMESLGTSGPAGFSKKVTYLYKMQQNEADIIAINKVDTLSTEEHEVVEALVAQNFPDATPVSVSALNGAGFDCILSHLEGDGEAGKNPARVDYGRYTAAEVALGWLNARYGLSCSAPWDGNALLTDIAQSARSSLIEAGVEIAHFKMRLADGRGREAAIHSTRNAEASRLTRRFDSPIAQGTLVVNLRAEGNPQALRQSMDAALDKATSSTPIRCATEHIEAFAPEPPVPPPAERNRAKV
jgi:G3E family GTPase